MILTVTRQAILNMVRDNSCIADFMNANVCTPAFFKNDYHLLSYLLDRYRTDGIVSLGDMALKDNEFQSADLTEASHDVQLLIGQLKGDYAFDQLNSILENASHRYEDPTQTFPLIHYIFDNVAPLLELENREDAYGVFANAQKRFEKYQEKTTKQNRFIPTGFKEIDDLIGGWSRDDGELASFLARMGMGKTWILLQSCVAAWSAGFKCGVLSIEMTPDSIGTRMDTLVSHLSNSALRRGEPVDMTMYQNYLAQLQNADPNKDVEVKRKRDFDGHITPSKIENWIRDSQLDIVYLDGIGYVESERFNTRNKSESSITTDVSEDLMSISGDTHCPVVITQQANRSGADRTVNPGLDSARGSDGANINASFVASIAHPDVENRKRIRLEVLKSRYSTYGAKFDYSWDPNTGTIQYEGEVNTSNGQSQAFFGKTS